MDSSYIKSDKSAELSLTNISSINIFSDNKSAELFLSDANFSKNAEVLSEGVK